jgi:hypothetical protein
VGARRSDGIDTRTRAFTRAMHAVRVRLLSTRYSEVASREGPLSGPVNVLPCR